MFMLIVFKENIYEQNKHKLNMKLCGNTKAAHFTFINICAILQYLLIIN